jgi:hypothetical protein
LRDGLILISKSSLQGNLRGKENETKFRYELGVAGIVSLGADETYSVGRKWRSALEKHGFLYPPPIKDGANILNIGPTDFITPNGWNLINADTVSGMQESFLRSLASYYLQNPKSEDKRYSFSPLRLVLQLMQELNKANGDSKLTVLEIGLFVIWTYSHADIAKLTTEIINYRNDRNKSPNKKKFDSALKSEFSKKYLYAERTFIDYGDSAIRYLKATGLVHAAGKGISLVKEKSSLINQLCFDNEFPNTHKILLEDQCNGAKLPTDDEEKAKIILHDLTSTLKSMGEIVDSEKIDTSSIAKINLARYQIEDRISHLNELTYAKQQSQKWEEINEYMSLIINNSSKKSVDEDNEISIPSGEVPAYFEWTLWRAFLAINHLHIPPNECRKFKIDQDFLPVGNAPGGNPDLIFEFDQFVIVVEVTLTANSRQEAAEGEPVRRHVADYVERYGALGKEVYGLFIANQIDSNTAETFRYGVWYLKNDVKLQLNIVPITLREFSTLFSKMFASQNPHPRHIKNILVKCLEFRNLDAPEWKLKISKEFNTYTNCLPLIN